MFVLGNIARPSSYRVEVGVKKKPQIYEKIIINKFSPSSVTEVYTKSEVTT